MLFKKLLIILLLTLFFTGCVESLLLGSMLISPTLTSLKHEKYIGRFEGYAFRAMINGVPVIELSSTDTVSSLVNYYDKNSIKWTTLKPISGDLTVKIKRKYIDEYDIGRINPKKFALSAVLLSKKNQDELNPSAAENFPTVHFLNGETLANGDYVLLIQVQGSDGWDRKEIYLEVRNDESHEKFL